MREKCFEIGTIQAFLDGELASAVSENVARHVAVCSDCAVLMAEAGEESAFAFAALESELNTLVPTQRLWSKINHSIGKEEKSLWQKVFAFVSNPTSIAFASMLIVFGLFVAVLSLRNNQNTTSITQITPNKSSVILPVSKPDININQTPQNDALPETKVEETKQNKKDYQVIKTTFAKAQNNLKANKQPKFEPEIKNPANDKEPRMANENLLGEESYIKTIATLTKSVDSRKDEILKPSARFAFEKDLAVVDDAIKKMQAEVKKNPKNEAAKEVLRASYQNKIDLLNSVADKSELMASLK